MGAGVVAEVWPYQPLTSGILLLHGLANVPPNMKARLPIQLHVSHNDPFFRNEMLTRGNALWNVLVLVSKFLGTQTQALFLDPRSPDYNQMAFTEVWQEITKFLNQIDDT